MARKSFDVCRTVTPKGTRYYIDGRQVSRKQYDSTIFWCELSCLLTRTEGDVTRHTSVATVRE